MGTAEEDLASLNAAADRIRKIIPPHPYIQTIPQDGARWDHHHREASRVWRGQVPFDRDEPPDLQYQTFHYHEHGTDLIHLRVQSPPPQSRSSKTEPAASASSTPRAGPKKKISLADYKSNKNKSAVEDTTKTGQLAGVPEVVRIDTPERGVVDGPQPRARDFAHADGSFSLKRKRSSDLTDHAQTTIEADAPHSRSPLSHASDDAMGSPSATRKRRVLHDEGPLGLPPSPHSPLNSLMPGRLSPLRDLLPERLSPDLPANIVAELDRRAQLVRPAVDEARSPAAKATNEMRRADSIVPNEQDEEEVDADGEVDEMPDVAMPAHKSQEKDRAQANGSPHKTPRLLVKLKIPRRLRGDYRRLLRFPPKPAVRAPEQVDRAPTRPMTASNPADKPTSSKARIDHDTARKHIKADASPDKNHKGRKTPLQAPFQSPSIPSRQHATPSSKKLATSMARMSSTDGPPSAAATPASSSSISMPAQTRPSPSASTSAPTAESEAWSVESKRLLELGKTLKAAARAHEARDAPLSLLTNIESLCAFMLSFHAEDMRAQTQSPPLRYAPARRTWVSLHGFWRFVWERADKYPALRTVVGGLGLVYCARICAWASANAKEREREGAEAAIMLSRIGGTRVTFAQARQGFPGTWKRCLADEAEDKEPGLPGKYAGGMEMPVAFGTPTLRAIRTTLAMLEEWRLKEMGKSFQTTLRML